MSNSHCDFVLYFKHQQSTNQHHIRSDVVVVVVIGKKKLLFIVAVIDFFGHLGAAKGVQKKTPNKLLY